MLSYAQVTMAEMPTAKRSRYLSLGLPKADVLILADELSTADFFDATMAAGAPAKAAANWIMGDIMAACKVGALVWLVYHVPD
jgi:aspartyl-tRNA(Asn)/glutamyl-tRNA(Gln) amidotransferase subunit B